MKSWTIVCALALVIAGAVYILVRWRRSPKARRAMIVIAAAYFSAGLLLGTWSYKLFTEPKARLTPAGIASNDSATGATTSPANPVPLLPSLNSDIPSLNPDASEMPGSRPVQLPPLHYDPARAVLPDSHLTPGDAFPGVTAADICSLGWSSAHRHVTAADRAKVYAEYPNSAHTCACAWGGADCCEVDHLIPLELGGSNDIKNLWPQPVDPRPGSLEKDQLENDLHERVCKGSLSLSEAQQCIASQWVECWEKYVVPEYGPQWASENRHGW